jgi:hypothetical protein
LRTEPTKPVGVTYLLRFLHDLDKCHHLSSTAQSPSLCASAWLGQPSSWLGRHNIPLLHIYTCLSMSSSVSHLRSVLRPSVPRSKPPYSSCTAPSPSAQTRLTFSIVVNRLSAPHMQTTSQETCCTTQPLR